MDSMDQGQNDQHSQSIDEQPTDSEQNVDHDAETLEEDFREMMDEDDRGLEDDDDIEWATEQRWEPDERAKDALSFLSRVVDAMGMNVSVHLEVPEAGASASEIHLDMSGPDTGRVIGKKGQVLAALQYLVNRAVNRHGHARRHVILDAEGYRRRREESLASMARQLGEQAAREGKIITFEPMSPRDRRVVHLALANFEDVVTKSEGEGDERRVRIIPVRR